MSWDNQDNQPDEMAIENLTEQPPYGLTGPPSDAMQVTTGRRPWLWGYGGW